VNELTDLPASAEVQKILSETTTIDFDMVSAPQVGGLLRTLAASKSDGDFLELGTGTGVATAWLLDGMDQNSRLLSIENNPTLAEIAQKFLSPDPRLSLCIEDAEVFIGTLTQHGQQFDLIFADTWAGKYTHLEETLALLKPGGFYLVDDMLPQANWPDQHETRVAELITALKNRTDLVTTTINWASGLIIGTKLIPAHRQPLHHR
jgi:predicted O-methyltransferase YrrM